MDKFCQVKFHPLVLKWDFELLEKVQIKRVLRVIDAKLKVDPLAFGKPLVVNVGRNGNYELYRDALRRIWQIEVD